MKLVSSTSAAIKPMEPKTSTHHPATSFIKSLYNIKPLIDFDNETAQLHYMVINFKATALDLSVFVAEEYEKAFNPTKEDPTMRSTAAKIVISALFITVIYASQVRKSVVETMPILTNFYELGESIWERDIFKGFDAMGAIVDAIFNEESDSPIALKDTEQPKEVEEKEVENSEEAKVEVKAEPKKIKESEIEIVVVQEDDLPEDRL